MKNARKDFENAMRTALRHIAKTRKLPPLDEAVKSALKACYDVGYVEGIRVEVMASGRITIEEAHPAVTYTGLKFAYPYRDWKFIAPLVIAAIELIVIVIQTILCG